MIYIASAWIAAVHQRYSTNLPIAEGSDAQTRMERAILVELARLYDIPITF
jgi:hypothetical protein